MRQRNETVNLLIIYFVKTAGQTHSATTLKPLMVKVNN